MAGMYIIAIRYNKYWHYVFAMFLLREAYDLKVSRLIYALQLSVWAIAPFYSK